MNMMPRKLLRGFLPLILMLCGCATLGTKVEVVNPVQAGDFRTLVIAAISLDPIDEKYLQGFPESPKEMLVKALKSRIERQSLFDKVETAWNLASTGSGESASGPRVLLSARLKLTPKGTGTNGQVWWHVFDAVLTIELSNSTNGEKILQTRHDTFMGNSYMGQPGLEETIADVVNGAVKPFGKGFKVKA